MRGIEPLAIFLMIDMSGLCILVTLSVYMQNADETSSPATAPITALSGLKTSPLRHSIIHTQYVASTLAICSRNCENAGIPALLRP